jgi:hypothetical protein
LPSGADELQEVDDQRGRLRHSVGLVGAGCLGAAEHDALVAEQGEGDGVAAG